MKRVAPAGLLVFHMALTPTPASRPRVGKFGTYYGKNYAQFRKDALPLTEAMAGPPMTGAVVALVETVVTKPKFGKLRWPRGDVDNFVKGPLDVITKAAKAWLDDDQIVGLMAFKRYAAPGEAPGIHTEWFELEEEKAHEA